MGGLCRGFVPLLAWCFITFQEGKSSSRFPWGTQISLCSPGSQPNLGMGAVGCCTPYGFGVQPPAKFLLGCSVLCKAPAEIYGALLRARTEAAGVEHALGHPKEAFSLRVSWLALQNRPCTTPQARGSAAGDKSPLPIPTCPLQQRGACQEIPLA